MFHSSAQAKSAAHPRRTSIAAQRLDAHWLRKSNSSVAFTATKLPSRAIAAPIVGVELRNELHARFWSTKSYAFGS